MTDPVVPLPGTWPADDDELGIYVRRFACAASVAPVSGVPASGAAAEAGTGLPVAVKDLIWTQEGPPQDARSGYAGDATAVARLRQAGAVITGKTTTTELALGTPEPRPGAVVPRNPWHPGHWAGGSSSGSAIAVAVGAARGALGTDTAGSIRVPAAYCGVTGLLPSYGRVPLTGVLPLAFSLDRVGPLARTARDCALLLGVIAGHDPADPASAHEPVPDYLAALTGDLAGLRVGLCPRPGAATPAETPGPSQNKQNQQNKQGSPDPKATADQEDPALGPAFAAAAEVLRSLGARLADVTLPYYTEFTQASAVIMLSEALSYHLPRLRDEWGSFGRSARTTLASAVLYSAADYVQAQRVRRAGRRALAGLLAEVDLVVTPTVLRGAPTVDEAVAGGGAAVWGEYGPICTPYWNMAGCPAVSVPMGFTGDGLPLGLQIAGRPFGEATVLRAADAFQRVTRWHEEVPPAAAARPPHPVQPRRMRGAELAMPAPAPPLTIAAMSSALRDGTVTSVELTEQALHRIQNLDPGLGAFLAAFPQTALAAAAASDRARASGQRLGPLHGIPLAVKDNLVTVETPATAQSLVPHHEGAGRDASAVARLRAAGCVIVGKTTLMEYACGLPDETRPFPVPRNPWDPGRWAGGSSSGTASGIAAGLFPGGIGTDTGGSIRIPAAFCGITGLMPTFGRVPRTGCVPLAYSLDHVGPMARSARDCALLLTAMAGPDAADPCSADVPVPRYADALTGDLSGLRIGVDRRSCESDPRCDPATGPALDAAVGLLRAAGAAVTDVTLPLFPEMTAACDVIYAGEMLAYQLPQARERLADYVASNRISLGIHTHYSGADYVQAQRVRRAACSALQGIYDEVDLVLTPTCAMGAIPLTKLGETFHQWFQVIYTPYWDGCGHPVISVPMGFTGAGLPLAFQLAGRPFGEATVLRAADAYQRQTDWHLRAPQWPR